MRFISEVTHEATETYQRLLEAAGEIFAERGFRPATVREICRKANANVAAVHYHFGDKDGLYAAVLKHTFNTAMEKHPLPAVEGTAEAQLRAHIHAMLKRIFDEGRPSWHGKLIAREMADPTHAFDSLVSQIRINQRRLSDIIRQLLGPGPNDETVLRCTFSVSGQCLFYYHCRAIVSRLRPGHQCDTATVEALAEHITKFSLAALKEYRS
jgi:AcrR family transcriptional regulator